MGPPTASIAHVETVDAEEVGGVGANWKLFAPSTGGRRTEPPASPGVSRVVGWKKSARTGARSAKAKHTIASQSNLSEG